MSLVYRNLTGVINKILGSAIESVVMPSGVSCKGMCLRIPPGSGNARIMAESGSGDAYFTLATGEGIAFPLMKEPEERIFYTRADAAGTKLEVLLFD